MARDTIAKRPVYITFKCEVRDDFLDMFKSKSDFERNMKVYLAQKISCWWLTKVALVITNVTPDEELDDAAS